MYLIARNKIAEYIKQHPEAQTNFLVWLKEFPYREAKRSFNYDKTFSPEQNTTVESQFGNANYKIRYRVNSFLNTAYIKWVGTVDEYNVHTQKERANRRALYPDMKVGQVKITKVTLRPPDFDGLLREREVNQADVTINDKPHALKIISDEVIDFPFKTTTEYEAGLAKAINMFEAGPSTPEGLELAALVPRVVDYENKFILFPELDALTVIKLKKDEWGMGQQYPLNLIKLIGSKEELVRFLSGDKPLSKRALAIFYNYLKIDFMDNEA